MPLAVPELEGDVEDGAPASKILPLSETVKEGWTKKKKSDVTYATSRAPGGGAQNALCEYIWSARDKMIAG